ncbi:helicase-related protein [Planococcus sp. YIM B11945]|uniref:helicase-related protein n=1 Tax=Planococcus sp. YIM B11945 TaxID=3435410 RepID=UPI003D7E33B3
MVKLENSLHNRELIIKSIEEEIIGPGNIENCKKAFNGSGNTLINNFDELGANYYWLNAGIKEEVLQKDSPSRRYAAGMLYPAQVKQEEVSEEAKEIGQTQEEGKEGFYSDGNSSSSSAANQTVSEDSGLDEEPIKVNQNDFAPSTMGLTFCVDAKSASFEVEFSAGLYKAHKVEVDVKGQQKEENDYKFSRTWWLRETIKATKVILLSDFSGKANGQKLYSLEAANLAGERISKIDMKLHIQWRLKGKYLLITATVLNKTKMPYKAKLDEHTTFQSKIEIFSPNNGFLNYPKAYERNLPLNEEDLNNELLFRKKANYAFGHGCSVTWNQHAQSISSIQTTFVPRYETESMTPDVKVMAGGKEVPLVIRMQDLAKAKNYEDIEKVLLPLIEGYGKWILEQEEESHNLPKELKDSAAKNLNLCKDSLKRMEKGLVLLQKEEVLTAFKLANKAMLLQQINGKTIRMAKLKKENNQTKLDFDIPFKKAMEKMGQLDSLENSWRAFQISFFLLSIPSLVEKDSIDRETVDLIWFPTGGGKTEAYLGVAAFQMFYRRILNPEDAGVDIIMRYTLRLLTADQFQRAARLMCSMEYIRRKEKGLLGQTPYSIGIWVGAATSPNSNKIAIQQLRAMPRAKGQGNFVVTRCPWCGCGLGKIGSGKEAQVLGFSEKDGALAVSCPDRNCDFSDEIPVYFVDEAIYKKQPTFLIGTVDKFVQLTWKPEARTLFGINKEGERVVSPPQIIVQDELHLISGPLGTLTGLYEVLIEELCIDDRGEEIIRPKIISATATIKEFEEQAKCLFGRTNARLFPSPGIDIDDSFFAKVDTDEEGRPMPGRKYVGVYTSVIKILMAQVMAYSAIMQKVEELPPEERDPFWTMLSFYNSLRDLGAGLNLFNSDIPTYIDALVKRENIENRRYVGVPLELTSRKQSSEITQTIDDLNYPYKSEDKKSKNKALSACLASNIIEVGVDIDRLSLMGIVGQPKMTAQYIQVSGRVGRRPKERPGLIVMVYSNKNSRDKSHYEHFNEYHQRLYAQVETTSLTPFSSASIDRGLTAVLIAFLRQRLSWEIAQTPDRHVVNKFRNDRRFVGFLERANARVSLIDEGQLPYWKESLATFMNALLKGSYETWGVADDARGLMYQSGNIIEGEKNPGSIPVINSLRSVDVESRGVIVQIEREIEEFVW